MLRKTKNTFSLFNHIPRALRLVWQATGAMALLWLAMLIVQGLIPAGIIYLISILVDLLAEAIVGGSVNDLMVIVWPAIGIGVLMFFQLLLDNGISWISVYQAEHIGDYLAVFVHNKSTEVDFAFYETPDFHDSMHRARDDALYLPLELMQSIGEVLQNLVSLIALSVLLIPFGLWMPLALFVSTLPAFLVLLRNHTYMHSWWENTTADRRWAKYYDNVLILDETQAEIRLYKSGPYFINAFQEIRKELRNSRLDVVGRQHLSQIWAGILALLISAVTAVWILLQTVQGAFSLGDLTLMYQAFNQGQVVLRSLFGNVGQIYRHMLFLDNLFAFLDLESDIVENDEPMPIPIPLKSSISFENITFRYPGSERIALVNFSITIPQGKTVAIVGENGAGKSTLLKLLCRFYDPQEGFVRFDDVDLKDVSLEQLRSSISVMFQQPVPYHATAAENIRIGAANHSVQQAEIMEAAKSAGVHDLIMSLPNGYETLLGKWFVDGTGLSGGEWQRIALARAFLRQSEIIVLDEPTSAMDSWAEAAWLDRFHELVKEKTAIVITHRFTTAMRADIIYVMQEGRVVESGNHQELLAQNGMYAESWRRQVKDTWSVELEVNERESMEDVMHSLFEQKNAHDPEGRLQPPDTFVS